jgi:outer membrane immunogenic protein
LPNGDSVPLFNTLDCAPGLMAWSTQRRGTMKRLAFAVTTLSIVGGSALAADLPPPMAPPPRAPAAYVPVVAPPYSWGGFYIGGNFGAAWNSGGSVTDTLNSTFSGSGQTTKFTGGGQVGWNYEFLSGVVIGAEAMFDWLPNTTNTVNVTNSAIAGFPGTNTATATLNSRWLTTVTGKLGYAWDRVLVYGKGGGAWVGADNPNLTINGVPTTLSGSTTTNFGWTAGVGVEWAFAYNVSARIEYDFIGLQNQSITVPAGSAFGGDTINFNNRNISLLTAGLNYRFGGGWW